MSKVVLCCGWEFCDIEGVCLFEFRRELLIDCFGDCDDEFRGCVYGFVELNF